MRAGRSATGPAKRRRPRGWRPVPCRSTCPGDYAELPAGSRGSASARRRRRESASRASRIDHDPPASTYRFTPSHRRKLHRRRLLHQQQHPRDLCPGGDGAPARPAAAVATGPSRGLRRVGVALHCQRRVRTCRAAARGRGRRSGRQHSEQQGAAADAEMAHGTTINDDSHSAGGALPSGGISRR